MDWSHSYVQNLPNKALKINQLGKDRFRNDNSDRASLFTNVPNGGQFKGNTTEIRQFLGLVELSEGACRFNQITIGSVHGRRVSLYYHVFFVRAV